MRGAFLKDYIEKVYKSILKDKLINENETVIVAVSGGSDSIFLLNALFILKERLKIDLYVCHINHGIRAEAIFDAKFVEEYCVKNKLKFRIYNEQVFYLAKKFKLSIEEAGRDIRYKRFFELAKEIEAKSSSSVKIALAHNKNDVAETFLFNLSRGTSLRGLSGIRSKRDKIIRPILDFEKREIEEILKRENISYRIDETNLTKDYTRNIIRHDILSVFEKKINNLSVEHIIRASKFISQADTYIEDLALKKSKNIFLYKTLNNENILYGMKIKNLSEEKEIIRTYIIKNFLYQLSNKMKDIEEVHIKLISEFLKKETGKVIDLPYNISLIKKYTSIELYEKTKKINLEKFSQRDFSLEYLSELEDKVKEDKYIKYFDYDKIKGKLDFRTRISGDYIHIRNGRKSIKSFMTDEKIDRNERDKIPLVTVCNDVLWVVGYRVSAKYMPSEKTKNILKITYIKG